MSAKSGETKILEELVKNALDKKSERENKKNEGAK